MQHIEENLKLKSGRLQNVIIAGHKSNNIPVYERGDKGIQFLFKEYQDSLPENEGSIGFSTFHDIFRLMMIRGDSEAGLSIY